MHRIGLCCIDWQGKRNLHQLPPRTVFAWWTFFRPHQFKDALTVHPCSSTHPVQSPASAWLSSLWTVGSCSGSGCCTVRLGQAELWCERVRWTSPSPHYSSQSPALLLAPPLPRGWARVQYARRRPGWCCSSSACPPGEGESYQQGRSWVVYAVDSLGGAADELPSLCSPEKITNPVTIYVRLIERIQSKTEN